jgi:hypothetical protein
MQMQHTRTHSQAQAKYELHSITRSMRIAHVACAYT